MDTVRRARDLDPAFDLQVIEARELYADKVEEDMMALGERANNPVPAIVRLKALRPALDIERHAVMSLNLTATTTTPADLLPLLHAMLADASPATRALLAPDAGIIDVIPQESDSPLAAPATRASRPASR